MYLSMEDLRKTWKYKFYRFLWVNFGKLQRKAGSKIVQICRDNDNKF